MRRGLRVEGTREYWDLIERFSPLLLSLFLIYAFARSVVASSGKAYWYDEMLTKLVVSRGSWSGMMEAVRAPLDTQPPLFYLVEHWWSRWIANQDLALRLPSALAVVLAILCIYVYARREWGAVAGLLSASFFFVSIVFQYYGAEARPYSLLVGCIALAMVCYQRADKWPWVAALGLTLGLAESLHYLAVLAIVPFGLAELYETYVTRRVRWGIWAALMCGAVAVIPSWGILQLNRAFYGPRHVSLSFKFLDISHIYGEFFEIPTAIGTGIAVAALLAIVLGTEWATAKPQDGADAKGEMVAKARGSVLQIGLILLPFIGYVFARATHSGLFYRYVLPGVLGIVLAVGQVVTKASRRTVAVLAALIFSVIGLNELHFWRFAAAERRENRERGKRTAEFINGAGRMDLPVVIPNGDVLWMALYAYPRDPNRLVYLTEDHDTLDKGVTLASRYVAIRVEDLSKFFAESSEFLVYRKEPDVNLRWVEDRLPQDWSVERIAHDGERELDLVTKNTARGQSSEAVAMRDGKSN